MRGVEIIKVTESSSRMGEDKVKSIGWVESYPIALKKIEELSAKNKNPRVSFTTGGTIYK